jgi:DNA polymerase-3 subunit alpha
VTRPVRAKIKSGPNEGRYMGRFVLEDLTGTIPAAIFANQLQLCNHLLEDGAVVLVQAAVRERGGDVELSIEEMKAIERPGDRIIALDLKVRPHVPRVELLKLRDILVEHPGTVPVKFHLDLPEGTKCIRAGESYKVDAQEELLGRLESLLGEGSAVARRLEA